MVRTQIMLEGEAHRRARDRSAQLGISLAEYVRRLIASDLDEDPTSSHPSVVFDLGSSGGGDVSKHKDRYIGEAVSGAHATHGRRRAG